MVKTRYELFSYGLNNISNELMRIVYVVLFIFYLYYFRLLYDHYRVLPQSYILHPLSQVKLSVFIAKSINK